ncbi:terminase large subunit domain-containing protein [Nonomuraea gerenzanensis]|uniref:terminase large subunit domain-containing protein n=1 Tax=Nonomuraea gerenzanensis TaxID=93944 RepID=UPI001CD96670|nr:terminase large subunit [Nonomuraea gerenzanensis]UBU10021.1 terminase large subunit [Nonomuraea gerenzanensis]
MSLAVACRPLSAPRNLGWPSHGRIVCGWIQAHCVYGEGDYFGQPVRLQRWQKQIIYWLYEYNPATGERRFREALIEVPKGQGKTPLNGWIQLFELLGPPLFGPKGSPLIPVAAASFEQADLLFGDMKHCCRESPTLRHHVDTYDTEILVRSGPGRSYRVAAVAGTNDGQRPSSMGADEIHEWLGPKERVHLVLVNGMSKRANSLVVNTTTPGSNLDTMAGRKHLYGYRVNAGEVDDPRFMFVHYGIPDGLYDLTVEEHLVAAVLAANPAAGTFLRTDDVVARFYQIPEFEYRRYHLGQWTRADESWLPPGAWESCAGQADIRPDLPSQVAVDMALKHDSVAVVVAQQRPDGRVAVQARVWDPAGDTIDVHAVENHLRQLHRDLRVDTVAYDPAYFQRSAEVLLDEGLPMAEFSQGASSMVPACQDAYRLICEGLVVHGDDPVLTDHVLSAAVRETDTGWRLSKGRSRRKIDACIAMVMALFLSQVPAEVAAPPNLW